MNYSEPLISQVIIFCRAIGCGILLGVLYGVISFIRMLFGERKGIYIIFDTAFFIIASFVSFFFMVLYNSGQVRLNLMLAELAGGTAFHFSVGKYILERCSVYFDFIRKILSLLLSPFRKTALKASRFSKKLFTVTKNTLSGRQKKEKNPKKISNIGKILLKNKNKSV